jgi:RNA polymerase sigma factor (sigma-70 family)
VSAEFAAQIEEGLPHRKELRRMVRNILRNNADVEDVLQEVHLAALLALRVGVVIDEPRQWLRKTARNRAVDVLRRRRPEVSLETLEISVESVEQAYLHRAEVEVAMVALSERQREAVAALMAERTLEDAATRLGITKQATQQLLQAAVEVLRGGSA